MAQVKAVISVIGRDQKGVVARFATHLAEHGVNILDIEQQVVQGQFIMDMLVDLSELTLSLDRLITELLTLGKQIDMDVRVVLANQRKPKRVAVLVSREAHCLEQMIQDAADGAYRGELVCVLSNHPLLQDIASQAGLTFEWRSSDDKAAHFQWLLERLAAHEAEVVVLARYMQVVPDTIVQAYQHRIINIHPSLLPYFPGAKPYHQAWEKGVRVTGCTAHFVTEKLDEGPIILQDVFHINVGKDTAADVQCKGQALEGHVLSQAVRMVLDEKSTVVDGKVVFRPGLSSLLDHDENV